MNISLTYLIKNGKPIGFEKDFEELNIGVDNKGKINYIGSQEPKRTYDQEIDLNGDYLSPGWIDLHTHIYGVSDIAVNPKLVGPSTGVILPVDAGTSGEASFNGFKEYIISKYDFPIKAFLNISSTGIIAANRVSELSGIEFINLDETINCIENNKDIIKGIKIRASRAIIKNLGNTAFKLAKKVSHIVDLPLVVHIGEPPLFLEDLVKELDKGDMITHCFNGKRGSNMLQEPDISKHLKYAQKKGILLDVGHGSASYSQAIAKAAFSLNIYPFSISTDIHNKNIMGPVWDLPTTMSKIMSLGFNIREVIEKVTKNPAKFLKLKDWPKLKKGNNAYFTAFEIKKGKFPVEDAGAVGEVTAATPDERFSFILNYLICPKLSFYKTRIIQANGNYKSNVES